MIDPRTLLTPNCFDVGAKTLYARHFLDGIESDWGQKLYSHHLKVWNGLLELSPPKKGLAAYLKEYQKIIEAMRDGSFDFDRSPIPVNKEGKIINGRHRLAAAIACDRSVAVRECPDEEGQELCDFSYLQSLGLEERYADAMAAEYALLKDNVYVAVVFAKHKTDQMLQELATFGRPLYWKSVELFGEGPRNLMRELYLGEHWLGNWEDGFAGASEKADLALRWNRRIGVYLFEGESLEKVTEGKLRLRQKFKRGQHALHINDSQEETDRLCKTLLNQNSLHFLNRSTLRGYANFHILFEQYQHFLQGKQSDGFAIDTSAVLAAYGLRDCRDLDFISREEIAGPSEQVNNHNEELSYHTHNRDDLLYNPENHFWHCGTKFIALHQVQAMKAKRGEAKDMTDCAMIKRLDRSWQQAVTRFLNHFTNRMRK